MFSLNASQVSLASRFGAAIFIFGKIIRFLFFFIFLLLLGTKTKLIVGYTLWQIIIFFLTFNLVDTLAQLLLREVYRFRSYVVTGDFGYFLTKPLSPLFRSLFGGTDVLDISMLILSVGALIFAVEKIGNVSFFNILIYIILIINAFIIALSFHILVLSIGIMTTEVDSMIMLYRDLTQMGRVPIDFYTQPIRGILTFAVPVGIMMTVPAKALLGLLSWGLIPIAILISATLLFVTIKFWSFALRGYTSASS